MRKYLDIYRKSAYSIGISRVPQSDTSFVVTSVKFEPEVKRRKKYIYIGTAQYLPQTFQNVHRSWRYKTNNSEILNLLLWVNQRTNPILVRCIILSRSYFQVRVQWRKIEYIRNHRLVTWSYRTRLQSLAVKPSNTHTKLSIEKEEETRKAKQTRARAKMHIIRIHWNIAEFLDQALRSSPIVSNPSNLRNFVRKLALARFNVKTSPAQNHPSIFHALAHLSTM